jgi:hypothetical protein
MRRNRALQALTGSVGEPSAAAENDRDTRAGLSNHRQRVRLYGADEIRRQRLGDWRKAAVRPNYDRTYWFSLELAARIPVLNGYKNLDCSIRDDAPTQSMHADKRPA